MLHALKCNNGLSYFYARPLGARAATNWLAAQVPAAGSPILMLMQQKTATASVVEPARAIEKLRQPCSGVLSLQPTELPASSSSN